MSLRDLTGQQRAVDILINAVNEERVSHAYLFLGPEGTGKFKAAVEFAKLLNCPEKSKGDSCGRCDTCLKIERLAHPDIYIVQRDTNKRQLPIDKIRELKDRFSFKPFEAKYKVAIIAGADDMNEEASNSLLKMLEEPEQYTVFILTASDQKALADTVISRCQIIRFRPLTQDEVSGILVKDFSIDEKEARFLSSISNSNIKKALELREKDRLSWKNAIIDEFKLSKVFLNEKKCIESWGSRQEQTEALYVILNFYRDILVYKFTQEAKLIINVDRLDEISKSAHDMEVPAIQRRMEEIERIISILEGSNVNAKLAIRALKEKLA